ncbi:MAG TPA: hypothetical protein VGI39_31150 [Polyangiaceae bacterium]
MIRLRLLALGLASLLACSTRSTPATTTNAAVASDAGEDAQPPPSAYAECDPASGAADASTFMQTASCVLPQDDAGQSTSCQDWWQGPDGDWSAFIDSCANANGTLGTAPCPTEGLVGTCTLPAECTHQTVVYSYAGDAGDAAALQATCTDGGVWAPAP